MMLVLETSYSAFGGAASAADDCRAALADMRIGFFLGAGGSFASAVSTWDAEGPTGVHEAPSVYSGTAGALSVASGRVSYALGLIGPCLTLDTACSSSLVAGHLVTSALKLNECSEGALAGVGLTTALGSLAFSAAGMLSRFGRCHTFDRRGDGYCRGEGCSACLLSS